MSQEEIVALPKGPDKSKKEDFIVSSNYYLNDLLLSGDVLLNDPISVYVNKVADELLKNDPAIRKELKFFVTKYSEVNAFAYDKGYIFINIGLLAQLENEAQLAYVLGHEITHAIKDHSMTEFLLESKIKKRTRGYDPVAAEERALAKFRFSKTQETEADIEGLNLIKKSKYSLKAVDGALDVLQYSYLPFELVPFKKAFFEDKGLVIPDNRFLTEVSKIKSEEDYDDSKSSHPNIRKRRLAIAGELNSIDDTGRKKYLVSEEEFKRIREAARFELCRIYLIEREYIEAVYAGYLLLQKYPDNLYLHKIVAHGMFNVLVNKPLPQKYSSVSATKIRKRNEIYSSTYGIPDYTTIEGASQSLYHLIQNFSVQELNTIILSYTYRAHKKFPEDKALSVLTDSLFSAMIKRSELQLKDFSKKVKGDLSEDASLEKRDDEVEESKYAQIKREQEATKSEVLKESFIHYAFVDFFKDDEFTARYNAAKERQKLNLKEILLSDKDKPDEFFLGAKKIIFIPPFYTQVDPDRDSRPTDYLASEKGREELTSIQEKAATRLNLPFDNIYINGASPDINKFNDHALLTEWLKERFKHGNNEDEIVTSSDYVSRLIKKYGTKYVGWSGVSVGDKTSYFFIVFDLETGKIPIYEKSVEKQGTYNKTAAFVSESLKHVGSKTP
ncbi:MAG TPA: M48 family metallopeptidase [Bacteroidia bacterium]